MELQDCLLSIIVPVYNTEEYLRMCLDSLLNQNFDRYEIICINDGSKDNSLSVLLEYEKKNSKIRVVNQKNGGVCNARNKGIDVASGKWIWFVDSDDYIPFNCLNYLALQLDDKIDYLAFDYCKVDKIQSDYFNVETVFKRIYMNSTIECLTTFPTKNYGNGPCTYIYFERRFFLKITLLLTMK